ncbi:MAG: hypothetical protein ACE5KM_13480 [Planctomycetaceae bacterium]
MRVWFVTAAGVILATAGVVRHQADRPEIVNPPRRPPAGIVFPLTAGHAYAVAISSNAECTLPCGPDSRYLLVVGSLGNPDGEYRVGLTSDVVDDLPGITERKLGRTLRRLDSGRQPGPAAIPNLAPARMGNAPMDFFLHVAEGRLDDPRQYARIATREIALGAHVRVLVDRQVGESRGLQQTASEIVRLFEREILPRFRTTLGPHCDTDGDGRLTVVLTPWLGRLQGGRTSLGGMVRPSDFRLDTPRPFSNRCDVLFLNPSLKTGPKLRAVLVHEYAHVVTFSRRFSRDNASDSPPDMDDWLSEGIAHTAEHLQSVGWSNLDHRVAAYLRSPQSYPLVISDYYRAGLWRNDGCRGATFLFLRWCADRFGEAFLRRMVDGRSAGVSGVEEASGRRFADVFRDWTAALAAETCDGPVVEGRPLPRYSSIRLRGRLGTETLAGPAVVAWDGVSALQVAVRGTSVCFVRLSCPVAGTRRLRIQATPGARLQLTIIRLPSGPREKARQPGTASKPGRLR